MPLEFDDGILISSDFDLPTLEDALPKPQIEILRNPQHEDAWCYAACAEMVINHLRPEGLVSQCDIASFAKDMICCGASISECTDKGCKEDQIGPIFTNFGVDYDGYDPHQPQEMGRITLDEIMANLTAQPPRPIEAVIDWDVGNDQSSSHAVLIVGATHDSVFLIDPLTGTSYDQWQPFEDFQDWFGHGSWVRTWPGLRRRN